MRLFFKSKQVEDTKDAKVRVELAESYSNMVNTIAWKDLEMFMNELVSESIKDQDLTPIAIFSVSEAAEGRGIRKAIGKIKQQIAYYVQDKVE